MKGFTLVELLVVIGIIVILMTAALVAINPFKQFAMANNASRWSGVTTTMNAVSQRMVDKKGIFGTDANCTAVLPTNCPGTGDIIPTGNNVCMGVGTLAVVDAGKCDSFFDMYGCLVPEYIGVIPFDPQTGKFTSSANYNTRYTIKCDATSKRITIVSPDAQLSETITITR
jgi:prepilin-type N-terminal cleavage/methylation domain-containing protein